MKTLMYIPLTTILLLSSCINQPARQATVVPMEPPIVTTKQEASTQPPTRSGVGVPVEVLLKGSGGKSVEPDFRYITTNEELIRLWRQCGPGTTPEVNFETHCVLAFFMGQRKTGGFGYRPGEAFVAENGIIQLELFEVRPQLNDKVTQGLTSPFIVLKLPNTGKQPTVRITVK